MPCRIGWKGVFFKETIETMKKIHEPLGHPSGKLFIWTLEQAKEGAEVI